MNGRAEIVKFLLESGADKDVKGNVRDIVNDRKISTRVLHGWHGCVLLNLVFDCSTVKEHFQGV